jgi:hypothetical protein
MALDNVTRMAIRKVLTQKFRKAAGYAAMEHGVELWDDVGDAIIDTVITIVDQVRPRDERGKAVQPHDSQEPRNQQGD